ncbi:hypothetical protein BJY04DRAFT_226645 [Aspergillus karnatakaensis]|uniref:class I SAM-dependent methyltransferase n=1 Tax=Aspergillus karnatakaensis TaxID=1810916 RepID=UPI003CCCF72F
MRTDNPMEPQGHVNPLHRDKAETARLNEQHVFVRETVGGLIDKSIPLDKVSSIADVGTSIGIWLLDIWKLLDGGKGGSSGRYYHGFDISSAQFPPAQPADNVELSVHDILKPFPPEHLNRYDLVHVRFLVTAFPEPLFEDAVKNLLTIVKPSGYIQWGDYDFTYLRAGATPRPSPSIESWLKIFDLKNLSTTAPAVLHQSFNRAGLVNVANTSYNLYGGSEEFNRRFQKWNLQATSGVIPPVLLLTGEAKNLEDARVKTEEYLSELREHFAEGGIMDIRFGMLVGQKAD